jgi:general secretion pathway protein L
MTRTRIRVTRDTPVTGRFEWAVRGDRAAVLAAGTCALDKPAVSGECELVLAADLVLLERVARPSARVRRHGSALRFLVEEALASDPEQVHVAAEASPAGDELAVAIIDRRWFAELLARLGHAGIFPVRAYPESLLVAPLPGAWTVVLTGAGGFARTCGVEGFALDESSPGEPPAALKLALDRARAGACAPDRIVVRAAAELAAPQLERWSARLEARVEPGAPWHWSTEGHEPEIDLLQGEFAPRAAAASLARRLRRSAALAAALAVLYCGGVALDWAAKAAERRRLIAEMSAIHREALGESTPIVDAPLQMSRALADLRRRAGQSAPDDFLTLLAAVAAQLPDPPLQRLESIAYENGMLTVVLRAPDPAQAEALAERLRGGAAASGLQVRVEPGAAKGGGLLTLSARPAQYR